jgi:hypothetical protein
MGNLDGWNGDYSIHVLSAGMLCCSERNITMLVFLLRKFLKSGDFFFEKTLFYLSSFHYRLPFKGCSI